MAREKQAIDEKVDAQAAKQTIENVLDTLYANDRRGYFGLGMTPEQVKSEAIKQIRRKLSTLDAKAKESAKEYSEKGLAEFTHWEGLPAKEKADIARTAKEQHISLRKAYELRRTN